MSPDWSAHLPSGSPPPDLLADTSLPGSWTRSHDHASGFVPSLTRRLTHRGRSRRPAKSMAARRLRSAVFARLRAGTQRSARRVRKPISPRPASISITEPGSGTDDQAKAVPLAALRVLLSTV